MKQTEPISIDLPIIMIACVILTSSLIYSRERREEKYQ